MASGTLILVTLIFAIRGYFLSLPGVFARLIGLVSAYFVAFGFRGDLAQLLATRWQGNSNPLVLQFISSAVLFFGTLFLVSFLVYGLFTLVSRLIPLLRNVLSRDATGSRVAGAVVNGLLGAAVVLVGLWAWGLTLGKHQPVDNLQRFANHFGDSLLAATLHFTRDHRDPATVTTDRTVTTNGTIAQSTTPSARSERGTAEIHSADDPDKRLFIERVRDITESGDAGNAADLQTLLDNPDLQALANDPEVQRQALDYIQSNPDLLRDMLNNPKLRKLFDQWQQQQ